jgi:acyl-CoA dehydrogenase
MADRSFLAWPFFDDPHRALAVELDQWAVAHAAALDAHGAPVDEACRGLVRLLGRSGWLTRVVPKQWGGAAARLDVRTLCLIRERLAYTSGLADFAFAMQGLGSGPVTLFGPDALRARYLPPVARGEKIAAFAISEPEAGSDVGAMRTTARRDGSAWILDGTKTWISNAGIADHYVVFARVEPAAGQGGNGGGGKARFIALMVDAGTPGMTVSERIDVIAPHPLGTLTFNGCRVDAAQTVGDAGSGLRVALATLDVFRSTVGAAALGFARRALDEAVAFVSTRQVSGQRLADAQLTQARLADMAVAIDASALLIYRAAWVKDTGGDDTRVTREAAMAKLHATESAQRVIDDAVQLLGGRGVVAGAPVERLYREIRALRIYEGTSEIQKLVIAGQVLAAHAPGGTR